MEANRPGVMSTQRKCISRSQGCMAAQVIFHYRCEPTQVKIAISTGDHKGCFAVTVLRCDFLHDIIGRKCGNEAYTRRITREQFVREGIDVVIRNWHAHQSITGQKPITGRLVGNSSITRLGKSSSSSGTIAKTDLSATLVSRTLAISRGDGGSIRRERRELPTSREAVDDGSTRTSAISK